MPDEHDIELPFTTAPAGGNRAEQARRLGIALRMVREAAGLSHSELGAIARVSDTSVRGWEEGRQLPKITSIAQVVAACAAAMGAQPAPPPPRPAEPTDMPPIVPAALRAVDPADAGEPAEADEPADLIAPLDAVDPFEGVGMLDAALRTWLAPTLPDGEQDPFFEAMLGRFGWNRAEPLTLEEAGAVAERTRERARQIEARTIPRLKAGVAPAKLVERAAAVVRDATPCLLSQGVDAIAASGLSTGPLAPEGVAQACAFAGVDPGFAIVKKAIGATTEEASAYAAMVAEVERRAQTPAPLPIDALEDVGDSDIGHEQLRAVLDSFEWIHWLDDGHWFVSAEAFDRSSTLMTVFRKLGAACGALRTATIIRGLERVVHHGRLDGLPPPAVLERFAAVHPALSVHDGSIAAVVAPEDDPLSASEHVVVTTIRDGGGAVSYAELRQAVVDAGFKDGLVSQLTQFSPILMRRDRDAWVLRSDEPEFTGRSARISTEVAARIRAGRLAAGLSQQALGHRVGADQPTVSLWETARARPSASALAALEDALGVSLDERSE